MKSSDIDKLSKAYQTILKEDLGLGPIANDQSSFSVGVNMPDSSKTYENEAADMASVEMQSIIKNAIKILSELKSGNIEPWVSSKISIATDYIETVERWLSNNHH